MEMLELLEIWDDGNLSSSDLIMPLEKQAKLLEKNYEIITVPVKEMVYDQELSESIEVITETDLIKIKNIVIKYRPHLHMGDFWVRVKLVNNAPHFRFFIVKETNDGKIFTQYATHPHIQDGIPCLGSFATELQTFFDDKNYFAFIRSIRSYLESYNGRSTYQAGTHWKKKKIAFQLYSDLQIRDIFSEDEESSNTLRVGEIARDPLRWNFPRDIPCWGHILTEGHEAKAFNSIWRLLDFPYMKNQHMSRNYISQYARDDSWNKERVQYQKIMGYIYLAMEFGEMNLFNAMYFNKIFMTTLMLQQSGIEDKEISEKLQKMSNKVSKVIRDQWRWSINDRYTSRIMDEDLQEELSSLQVLLKPYEATTTDQNFVKNLKSGGERIAQYIVLLRKNIPHKAKSRDWLKEVEKPTDPNLIIFSYNKIKSIALKQALTALKSDERRMKNELKNSFTINSEPDVEQGSLFSTTE